MRFSCRQATHRQKWLDGKSRGLAAGTIGIDGRWAAECPRTPLKSAGRVCLDYPPGHEKGRPWPERPNIALPRIDGDRTLRRYLSRAGPTAAARVAEADIAAAVVLAARLHALTAGLERLAALGVAARARDAAAVLRVLALAFCLAEIELADLDVILGAAARKSALARSLTKALKIGAIGLIQAAPNAETALVFLKLELALRGLAHVAIAGRRRSFGCVHDCGGHRPSPLEGSTFGRLKCLSGTLKQRLEHSAE